VVDYSLAWWDGIFSMSLIAICDQPQLRAFGFHMWISSRLMPDESDDEDFRGVCVSKDNAYPRILISKCARDTNAADRKQRGDYVDGSLNLESLEEVVSTRTAKWRSLVGAQSSARGIGLP